MRYIENKNIKSLGDLSNEACQIAEKKRLAVLKTWNGFYKIISESGLGAGIDRDFKNLKEVDEYLKKLK